jgi:hypothetical protein
VTARLLDIEYVEVDVTAAIKPIANAPSVDKKEKKDKKDGKAE